MIKPCIDVTRGTAYGLAMSQLLLTIACILYSNGIHVKVYTTKVPPMEYNETFTPPLTPTISYYDAPIQGMFLSVSCLAAFFATFTMSMTEQDPMHIDFSVEVMESVFFWDMLFWVYSFFGHLLVIIVLMQPGDVYLIVLSTLLMQYFLYRCCYPKSQMLNITQENINLLGYAVGGFLVFNNTPTSVSVFMFIVVILDYFMGIGHTWDKQCAMDTIINCRLFYICTYSFFLCVFYTTHKSYC